MTKEEDLVRRRLRRQYLIGKPLATPEAVVGWLGAVQSQELAVAKWGVAQRSAGVITEARMDRALAEGKILRTHLLRPTWHFVLPADIRWMLELTAPRIHALSAYHYRQVGMTEALVRRSQTLIRQALAGGQHWTRKEIAALFERSRLDAAGMRLGYLLMRAELDLLICSGAARGKQQTYALLDERVPPTPARSRDEALAELTRRYFASHGPATLKDFVWWSSLPVGEARRGLEMLGPKVEKRVVAERTYWLADAAQSPGRLTSPTLQLLQGYDEYLVAYSESKRLFGLDRLPGATAGQPLYLHAIVRDGQVVGHWGRIASAKEEVIQAHLKRPLDPASRRALQAELARYARYLGRPTRLVA